jgi:hypothetical protein
MNEIDIIVKAIQDNSARLSVGSMKERNLAYEYGATISQIRYLLEDLNLTKKQKKILLEKADYLEISF